MKILPSITTAKIPQFEPSIESDWRSMIKEAKALGLTEVAFFPTFISQAERAEAYVLLKENGITDIPFVHLRSDTDVSEIELLIREFNTQFFNIHPHNVHPLKHNLDQYKDRIYIETQEFMEKGELSKYAGICIDVTHVFNFKLTDEVAYQKITEILRQYPIGCAHISAIKDHHRILGDEIHYDYHNFENLSELDYVKQYKDILPPIVALELENTLAEQLKARDYILNLLKS